MNIRRGSGARDLNEVVRLHREVYEAEFGLDETFAQSVATRLAELRREGFPGPRAGVWLAERDGAVVGCITLNEEGPGLGQLGHLVLLPEARGTGAGRRLVNTVLEAAREAGYERLQLFTFGDLRAAGSLYRSVGFELTSSEDTVRWGRRMDWQRYELSL